MRPSYDWFSALQNVGSAVMGSALTYLATARQQARAARELEKRALQTEIAGLRVQQAVLEQRLNDSERQAS